VSAALGSSSGSPDLDQAAIATVQTWQFTATGDGRWGVPVYVDFELVE
jgi:TonB family protein